MTEQSITTAKLLALLNVSAAKPRKRARQYDDVEIKYVKLNRKSTLVFEETVDEDEQTVVEEKTTEEVVEVEEVTVIEHQTNEPSLHAHFANNSTLLTPRTLEAIAPPGEHSRARWNVTQRPLEQGRSATISTLEDKDGIIDLVATTPEDPTKAVLPRVWQSFSDRTSKLSENLKMLQNEVLPELLSYRDVHYNHLSASNPDEQAAMRDAISLHLVNHVLKRQQDMARNNSSTTDSDTPTIQDQGFVRPSTLILVPFRNSALRWMASYMKHFTSSSNGITSITNRDRFIADYTLPEGTIDKLAEAEDLGVYPVDHVQTFKGNIDDNFQTGVKVMKKSLKLFENFYGSDLIIASPLGLRLAIERGGNDDFLSSIEVVVVDQAEVMTMQNWTHLQFVFEHLNNLPKETHDTDFSRVKSWYLDGHAKYLRQNILVSAYETPQIRAFFSHELQNVAGKIRFERRWPGVEVPEGIKQEFVKFECSNAREEVDKRFEFFTKEFFPSLRKSAVLSANTLLFIPSYFDFIRVRNWLKKDGNVSATFISEDSTASEIDRARHQFDKGKKSFLVVTERFHFFRRYRIKGILNIIFYSPPDHANFYSELLTFPFFKKEVDGSDVSCKVIYSKYDAMALERLVGTREATALIKRT